MILSQTRRSRYRTSVGGRVVPVFVAVLVVVAGSVAPTAAASRPLDGSSGESGTSLARYTLSGCPNDPIEQPGVYELTGDITTGTEDDCITVNVSNVVIDGNGYALEGVGDGNGRPIYVWNRPKGDGNERLYEVTVRDVHVTGWKQPVSFRNVSRAAVSDVRVSDGGKGIQFRHAYDSRIVDATVWNRSNGIVLGSTKDSLVARNTLRDNRYRGLLVHSASHPEVWSTHNRIENNTVTRNGESGIELTESTNRTVVADNTVTENGKQATITSEPNGIFVGDSSHVRIVNNTVTDNVGNGISVTDAAGWVLGIEDVTLADNRIRRNERYGVRLTDSGDDLVVNNTVEANRLDGIVAWNVPDTVIRDNEVFDHADRSGDGRGIRVMNNYDGVRVVGNHVHDNRAGFSIESGSGELAVRGNRFVDNTVSGVRVHGSTSVEKIRIRHNVIARNGEYGVRNYEYNDPVDATHNWWGDASGPNSSAKASRTLRDPVTGTLADGTGDAVTEKYESSGYDGTPTGESNVHFDPWRTTTVRSCPDITTSGHHTLGQNITNSPERYCINVTADDVTLDGMGHVVDGVGGGNLSTGPHPPVGIRVTGENVTITNVTVTDWMSGIVLKNATGFVTHSNVTNADLDGIVVRDASAELRWNAITADDDGIQTTNSTVVVTDTSITNGDDTDLQRGVRATSRSKVFLMETAIENAAITGILVNALSEGRIRTTAIDDSQVGIEVSSRSTGFVAGSEIRGSDRAGVRVEWNSSFDVRLNNVTNVGGSAVVLGPRARAGSVQIHDNNFLDVGEYGVLNRNLSAPVDATNNYWDATTGPSSNASDPDAPFTDPVSGASADGSGATISEGSTAGVSNVAFAPFVTSPRSALRATTTQTTKALRGTTATATETDAGPTTTGSSGDSPGFTPVVALAALLAAALLAVRHGR